MNDNPTTGTTDKLSEFIGREREKYADTSLFAFGLGQAHRYYRFLHIIISRYADVSAKFMENTERQLAISKAQGSGPIGAEHWRLTLEARDLQDQLHLEIESFFLFGTIFLERAANFIETYFGKPINGRVNTRHLLNKELAGYAAEKNLALPEGLTDTMSYLEEELAKYRNKQITHDNDLRSLHGTTFDGEGHTGLGKPKINPRDDDKWVESAKPPVLLEAIERYVDHLISLIETNRSKTQFELSD